MKATVTRPMYDWDGRKYLELNFEGSTRRLKVPWRYGRVMCRVTGDKTVQELTEGDKVQVTLKTVTWDGLEHLVIEHIECLPVTDLS
jgi:hypothetical protein